MIELLFCNKCGNVDSSELRRIGSKCWICKEGTYVGTGVEYNKAYSEVSKEYKEKHPGDYPSAEKSDEMLREKYFYGKLDFEETKSALEKRLYSEFPEGIEEHNRVVDQWYLKQNTMNSSNAPKCPTCGSTYLRKITASRKILKVGLFGRLGTGDLGKTYQCCNCGVKF